MYVYVFQPLVVYKYRCGITKKLAILLHKSVMKSERVKKFGFLN